MAGTWLFAVAAVLQKSLGGTRSCACKRNIIGLRRQDNLMGKPREVLTVFAGNKSLDVIDKACGSFPLRGRPHEGKQMAISYSLWSTGRCPCSMQETQSRALSFIQRTCCFSDCISIAQ